MKSRLKLTSQKLLAGIGLAAIGTALGAVGSQALDDDHATVEPPAAAPALTGERTGAARMQSCSIYDVPTLDSTIVPRSTLADGSVYVMVCMDSAGREVVNEVFIHHLDGSARWPS